LRKAIRFSFSKYNTKEEIDYTVDTLKNMLSNTSLKSNPVVSDKV